eukprot:s6117_g1.t1
MLSLCFLFWLVCSHRIFLTHVLRLESVEHPAVELSPEPIQDGRDEMEVDAGGGGGADGFEPMTIDRVEEGVEVEEGDSWLNNLLNQTQNDLWNNFCLRNSNDLLAVDQENGSTFVEDFGGEKVTVKVPEHSVDEFTGAPLNHKQVDEGMKTEVQQLERLKVGRCLVEKSGRDMAKQKKDLVKSKEKEGDEALTQDGEARYRRLRCPEQISVFMCLSLPDTSQSRARLLKLACVLCCAGC